MTNGIKDAGTGAASGPGKAHPLPNRRQRAKARTRAALVEAAQRFVLDGQVHASILEITRAADVGLGSFYNHFDSREALFQTAVDDALDGLGQMLDHLGADLSDPAEVLAQSFRLTGRLFREQPDLMHVAVSGGAATVHARHGLVPRARRDLEVGIRTGRFDVTDADVALAGVVGVAICLGELLRTQPERDARATTDELAEGVLRMLGVPPAEAARIARLPLPDVAATEMRRAPLATTTT